MDGNKQSDIFNDSKQLLTSVIDGYNLCICAYGQTGAGKVFLQYIGIVLDILFIYLQNTVVIHNDWTHRHKQLSKSR
jgi:hypothetical protein